MFTLELPRSLTLEYSVNSGLQPGPATDAMADCLPLDQEASRKFCLLAPGCWLLTTGASESVEIAARWRADMNLQLRRHHCGL